MTELQRQVARLRVALNGLNDETGAVRTQEADVHFYASWKSLCALERLTGTQPGASVEGAAA